MGNCWGDSIKLSIFGESHGEAIGITIGGLPAGEAVDGEGIRAEMLRRAPGASAYATARSEPDEVKILSGLYNGKTTGSPVCGLIFNKDARSKDYSTALRPGHADITALIKYGGHMDMRGGGHFSGRLTAPIVFAGAVAKQILGRRGIEVYARISRIAGIPDIDAPDGAADWRAVSDSAADWRAVSKKSFPVFSDEAGERMKSGIQLAKDEGDSVGGVVETVIFGIPAGLGSPFFDSVESSLAHFMFSIPAVKGVEFGAGFGIADMRGSQANGGVVIGEGDMLQTRTNNNGGILGGITNGMPVVVRTAFKPTPSIAKEQDTVDAVTLEPVKLKTLGRHDPCIAPRAVPVTEAAAALCVLDMLLEARGERL